MFSLVGLAVLLLQPPQPDTSNAPVATDSGMYAAGRTDFSRYTTPGFCRAAAENALHQARRTLADQVLGNTLAIDTVGLTTVAHLARMCGARFTMANTPDWGREALFMLAIYEQNDELALTILSRAIQAGQTDQWGYGMGQFLKFGRLALAESLLKRVDALGSQSAPLQLDLHTEVRNLYVGIGTDTNRVEHEDRSIVQEAMQRRQEPVASGSWYGSVLEAYRDLMHLSVPYDTAHMQMLAHQAQADLGMFSLEEQTKALEDKIRLGIDVTRDRGEWHAFPIDTVISRLAPAWYAGIRYGSRKAAPPLHADFWWPAPGTGTKVPPIPIPGKINLICGGGKLRHRVNNDFYASYQQANHLGQWIAQYGHAGLSVTVLRAAVGLISANREDDFDVGEATQNVFVPDSAAEAEFWRWFDQDYHRLGAIEAVQVIRAMRWLPSPDGRKLTVAERIPNGYLDLMGNDNPYLTNRDDADACVLIGRDGNLLYKGNDPRYTAYPHAWDDILRWVFSQSSAQH